MKQGAVTTEYTVTAAGFSHPMTIALAADIHERNADDILRLIQREKPDIIAVAGDTLERYPDFDEEYERARRERYTPLRRILAVTMFTINSIIRFLFDRGNRADPENSYRFLREAAKCAPVYLSLGNHERKLLPEDIAFFEQYGITLLDNADVSFDRYGDTVCVGGLSTRYDEQWLERFARRSGYHILLCHHPEYYDDMVAETGVELTLSGHNHGGQIRIFGRGLMSSAARLFPKYSKGLYDNRLVVSAGCSNPLSLPRVNNPRELVIVKIKSN
jgi:predicted MPP superfamily phosphohydrolase